MIPAATRASPITHRPQARLQPHWRRAQRTAHRPPQHSGAVSLCGFLDMHDVDPIRPDPSASQQTLSTTQEVRDGTKHVPIWTSTLTFNASLIFDSSLMSLDLNPTFDLGFELGAWAWLDLDLHRDLALALEDLTRRRGTRARAVQSQKAIPFAILSLSLSLSPYE